LPIAQPCCMALTGPPLPAGCRAGPFELQIQGGIGAYSAPRPQLVVISSAGVERNAIIGEPRSHEGGGL